MTPKADFVESISDFGILLRSEENRGKTFQVSQDVFEHFSKGSRENTSLVRVAERESLASLLGIDQVGECGLTRSCKCAHCGYELSFADLAASAILSGAHKQEDLRAIITGSKYWITVDTNSPRTTRCTRCYKLFEAPHCCYTTSRYAYA